MKVLVTGASGFVGHVLVRHLIDAEHEVVVLTRNIAKAALNCGSRCKYIHWPDTTTLPPLQAFDGVEGVVNLMGENIANKKWDEAQKKEIHDSRTVGTAMIVEAMSKIPRAPKVLVSASAVGIYGQYDSQDLNESASLGNDFLAHVCKDWEAEANKARMNGIRVVNMRTGLVIGKGGGALKKMLCAFKLGLGGALGSGNQYMSWVHIEDLAAMYVEALKNEKIQGPVNGTAPYPVTNGDFAKCLGKVLKRPAFMKIPKFVLKLVLGEMSEMLIGGQKVLPAKMKEQKFRFRYPTLEMALKESI